MFRYVTLYTEGETLITQGNLTFMDGVGVCVVNSLYHMFITETGHNLRLSYFYLTEKRNGGSTIAFI